jgi:hypothetical protein
MTKGVLERIDDIRTELVSFAQSDNFDQILQGGFALEDSLTGVISHLRLLFQFRSFDVIPPQLLEEKCPTGLYGKVDHYYSNMLPLLMFIVDMMDEYRRSRKFDARDFIRITLDIEKLFSDVRSFLDALYKWLICYQADSQIRGKKRESADKFADWFERCKPNLACPASIFSEIVAWLLTVRALRDGYMHHGQESSVFLGDGEPYFEPRLRWGRVAERSLPDAFYVKDNPNNLVYLELSMGGCVAASVVGRTPRIKTLVLWAAIAQVAELFPGGAWAHSTLAG